MELVPFYKPLLHLPARASAVCCWTEGGCSACVESLKQPTSEEPGLIHTSYRRTRTMQSLRRTAPRPRSGPRNHMQGHLPGNLSCSDYTMCLASLWAILPFCSVKYEKRSGKGKGLGNRGESYQFTTFEFTEPGTGILL